MSDINIDDIDLSILRELSKDARAPVSTISTKVNLSIPAVSERIKKLEKAGYINKYTTVLNPKMFNKNLTCFSLITLRYEEGKLDDFLEFVRTEPDIMECHLIAGEYEYLLKIITDGPESLGKLLSSIRMKANVLTSSTSIILNTLKDEISYQPVKIK